MVQTRLAPSPEPAVTPSEGSVEQARAHAMRLVGDHPEVALAQAHQVLAAVPGHPVASLVKAQALRTLRDLRGARTVLEPLARSQPRAAAVHHELGRVLDQLGEHEAAAA